MKEVHTRIAIKEGRIFQKDSGQYSFKGQNKIMAGEYWWRKMGFTFRSLVRSGVFSTSS